MKNTKSKVEDIIGDVICKDNFSKDITKLNIFFGKDNVNVNINIKFNLFNSRKEKIKKL